MFGREHQSATCGEIERREFAPTFNDHRAQSNASRRIRRTLKQRARIGRECEQQGIGITPQFCKTGRMKTPAASLSVISPQPQDRSRPMPSPQREHRGKPCGTRPIIALTREQLMQPPLRHPAIKGGIQRSMPAGKALFAQGALRPDNSGDTPP